MTMGRSVLCKHHHFMWPLWIQHHIVALGTVVKSFKCRKLIFLKRTDKKVMDANRIISHSSVWKYKPIPTLWGIAWTAAEEFFCENLQAKSVCTFTRFALYKSSYKSSLYRIKSAFMRLQIWIFLAKLGGNLTTLHISQSDKFLQNAPLLTYGEHGHILVMGFKTFGARTCWKWALLLH